MVAGERARGARLLLATYDDVVNKIETNPFYFYLYFILRWAALLLRSRGVAEAHDYFSVSVQKGGIRWEEPEQSISRAHDVFQSQRAVVFRLTAQRIL